MFFIWYWRKKVTMLLRKRSLEQRLAWQVMKFFSGLSWRNKFQSKADTCHRCFEKLVFELLSGFAHKKVVSVIGPQRKDDVSSGLLFFFQVFVEMDYLSR